MNYLDETATPGEVIMGHAKISWLNIALGMVPFWLGIIGAYVALEAALRSSFGHYIPPMVAAYAPLVLLGGAVIHYLFVCLPWIYIEIAVTNRRIVYRHGLSTRQVDEISINRIEGMNLTQPLLGRIFNFGPLTIVGIGHEEIHLPPIHRPMDFRKAIQEAISEASSPDASFNSFGSP